MNVFEGVGNVDIWMPAVALDDAVNLQSCWVRSWLHHRPRDFFEACLREVGLGWHEASGKAILGMLLINARSVCCWMTQVLESAIEKLHVESGGDGWGLGG